MFSADSVSGADEETGELSARRNGLPPACAAVAATLAGASPDAEVGGGGAGIGAAIVKAAFANRARATASAAASAVFLMRRQPSGPGAAIRNAARRRTGAVVLRWETGVMRLAGETS